MSLVEERIEAVIRVANSEECLEGHYLWGAAGARPGTQDGIPQRRGAVHQEADNPSVEALALYISSQGRQPRTASTDPLVFRPHTGTQPLPCLQAASAAIQGLHFCAGRPEHPEVRRLQRFYGARPPQNLWSDPAVLREAIFHASIAPRGCTWPRPRNSDYGNPRATVASSSPLLWGEACAGIRHFDCVGFIKYILWAGLGKSTTQGIPGFRGACVSTPSQAEIRPGDLMFHGRDHIGLALSSRQVISCLDSAHGVMIESITSRWTAGRLPDSFWLPGVEVTRHAPRGQRVPA
jgi:hypothetical protein